MKLDVLEGDCRKVLAALPADSIDACLTDPPYHLTSIVKRFGSPTAAPAQFGTDGAFARASRGFMGKAWDGGDVAFQPETWAEVLRVLKPGAHMLCFGGTRTYHRLACAIEDAGFEIRDSLMWVYGTGFPKSHDVSKAIDKAARGVPHGGADPTSPNHGAYKGGCSAENPDGRGFGAGPGRFMATPGVKVEREVCAEATTWQGWGTAVKPAWEPLCLARKPLSERTIAANVLRWGCGGLNIDGCRIGTTKDVPASAAKDRINQVAFGDERGRTMSTPGFDPNIGRWPTNLAHDGSEEVLAAFAAFGDKSSPWIGNPKGCGKKGGVMFGGGDQRATSKIDHLDSGSAARFFFSAKADSDDRADSRHPTVKPVDLLRHYARLITPPGGTILDCFAGSGTTAEAAMLEGFNAILIDSDPASVADIHHRLGRWMGADLPLFAEGGK